MELIMNGNLTELFGSMVFNEHVMKERLPKETFRAVRKTISLFVLIAAGLPALNADISAALAEKR